MFIICWHDKTWTGIFSTEDKALKAAGDGRYEILMDENGVVKRVPMDFVIGTEEDGYHYPRVPLGEVIVRA